MPTLSTGRALLDSRVLLERAGLSSGMQYADFGSGTLGHFVFPASELVGSEGKVYAVDVLKSALAGVESRKRLERATNLETVWGDFERPGGTRLPDRALDLVSLVNVCQLIRKSPSVLGEVSRVLKPRGRVLLVDWKKDGGALGPPPEKRISPENLGGAIAQAGFAVEETFEAGERHWGLILRRA